jgi:hypothetical protein
MPAIVAAYTTAFLSTMGESINTTIHATIWTTHNPAIVATFTAAIYTTVFAT